MTINSKKVKWSVYNYSKSTPEFIVKIVASIKAIIMGSAITAATQDSPYWAFGIAVVAGLIDEISKGFGYED